jgi:hypothetical protein
VIGMVGEGGFIAEDIGECRIAVFSFEGGCPVLQISPRLTKWGRDGGYQHFVDEDS